MNKELQTTLIKRLKEASQKRGVLMSFDHDPLPDTKGECSYCSTKYFDDEQSRCNYCGGRL